MNQNIRSPVMNHPRFRSRCLFAARFWLTVILFGVATIFCRAHDQPVHEMIAESAANSSAGLAEFLNDSGTGITPLIFGQFDPNGRPPIAWIKLGAIHEDDTPRFENHFYTVTPSRIPGLANGLTDWHESLIPALRTTNSYLWGTAPNIPIPIWLFYSGPPTNTESWGCARSYYFDDKPYIFTVDLNTCTSNKTTLHYEAVGCGANLGGYLLGELSYQNMDPELATAIAVYVVESVKKHDAYCGGATKVAVVRRKPKTWAGFPSAAEVPLSKIYSRREVEKMVEIVSEMDKKTKKQRHTIIQKALTKENTRQMRGMLLAEALSRYSHPRQLRIDAARRRVRGSVIPQQNPESK